MAQFEVYTITWCGYCKNLKCQLGKTRIVYGEVDVEKDPTTAGRAMSFNGRNRTVPTLKFENGSVLTNPGLSQVEAKLMEL